jgi:F-type H+-transporting ATPase subunit b
MGDMFSQLGHLFLQATPTIVFVFFLFIILDRLFFRPVTRVLKQRQEATLGALARAREQAAAAQAKAGEYEAAFQAARQEVYRQREAERRTSLSERESILKRAREQSEAMLKEAQAVLGEEVAGAKKELDGACRALAEEMAAAILPPETSVGEAGGFGP